MRVRMTWDEAVEKAQRLVREWRSAGLSDREIRLLFRALQREWYTEKQQNEQSGEKPGEKEQE